MQKQEKEVEYETDEGVKSEKSVSGSLSGGGWAVPRRLSDLIGRPVRPTVGRRPMKLNEPVSRLPSDYPNAPGDQLIESAPYFFTWDCEIFEQQTSQL